MISVEEWVEEVVEKTEIDMFGEVGKMSAHNKSVLRAMLRREAAYWERYEGREEEGHSHSAVGDQFNSGR